MDLRFNITGEGNVSIVNSIVQGEDTILIITLPEDAHGYVNVTGNNIDFRNQVLVDGNVNITLTDLSAGNYNIVVDYSGDDKYDSIGGSVVLVVASTRTVLDIVPISTSMVGDNVSVCIKTDAEGNVTLYVNGILFNSTNIVDGWANFTITSITADMGLVNIFAVYESNGQYTSAFNSTTFSVEKYNTTISATSEGVNVSVILDVGVSGSVIVTFNGVNYTGVINPTGTALVILPKISGIYTLPVYYNGDSRYNPNSTTVGVNIAWGDDYLLNATVNGTGYVSVNIDNRAVNNVSISVDSQTPVNVTLTSVGDVKVGYYQLALDLSVGAHIVSVSYAGDDVLGPKSYSFIYNMAKKSSLIKNVTVEHVIEGSKSVINIFMNSTESGSVIVEINGINYTVGINDDGHAVFEIVLNDTTGGKVYYNGDDEFMAAIPFDFTAVVTPKSDSIVVIDESVLNIGESAIIVVTVNGVKSDDVIIMINGMETNIIDNVEAITYTINALFEGNSTHKANSTTKTFSVSKKDSEIKNVSVDTVINGTKSLINITMNSAESGNVIVELDGVNYTVSINEGNALFEILLTKTTSGKVYYLGNDVFAPADVKNFIATVNSKTDSLIEINNPVLNIGETTTVNALINGENNPNIIYTINGIVTNTINVEAITYTITALFEGNSTHKANSTTKTFNVEKSDSIVNINHEFDVDGNVVVSVEVMGATGQVILVVNGSDHLIDLDNGMCNYTIVNPITGDYKITAKYLGDNKYNAGENSTDFTVSGKTVVNPDTAFINPNKNNPTLFAITLPSNATGNFTVLVDGEEYKTLPLVNGKANINVTGLKSGVHTIGLVYSGDDNFTGINKSVELIIIDDSTASKQTANITVNITDNPVEGDNVLVNVTLDKNATGMVNINVDGIDYVTELVNGSADYTIVDVVKGNHSISVIYFGDNNYNNATVNTTFSVSEDASYIDPDNAFINPDKDNPTLFAVDLPVNATGNFTILVDGEEYKTLPLVDGKANITVSGLSDGNHDISMLYSGDDYYKPIAKSSSIFVINDGNSTGGGRVSPGDADNVFNLTGVNATPAVFTINLPSNATGNFTVSIGGKDYTSSVVNGTANITISNLSSGVSSVVVSYSGDDYYDSLFKTATVNIPSKPTPSPSPAPVKVTPVFKLLKAKKYTFKVSKATKKVKVTLQTPKGVKVAKVNVVFKFNKKALKKLKAKNKKGKKLLKKLKKGFSVKTNAKGVATLKLKNKFLTFKKAKLAFTVTFNGNNIYNKATAKGNMKIK